MSDGNAATITSLAGIRDVLAELFNLLEVRNSFDVAIKMDFCHAVAPHGSLALTDVRMNSDDAARMIRRIISDPQYVIAVRAFVALMALAGPQVTLEQLLKHLEG